MTIVSYGTEATCRTVHTQANAEDGGPDELWPTSADHVRWRKHASSPECRWGSGSKQQSLEGNHGSVGARAATRLSSPISLVDSTTTEAMSKPMVMNHWYVELQEQVSDEVEL